MERLLKGSLLRAFLVSDGTAREMMTVCYNCQSATKECRRFALVAFLAISGCFPAPRAYRIFLPPTEAQRDIEARLSELQERCDRGDLTTAECVRRRQELRTEMDLYKKYREKSGDHSE